MTVDDPRRGARFTARRFARLHQQLEIDVLKQATKSPPLPAAVDEEGAPSLCDAPRWLLHVARCRCDRRLAEVEPAPKYPFDTIMSIMERSFMIKLTSMKPGAKFRLPFGCQPPFWRPKSRCRQVWRNQPMLLTSLRFSALRPHFRGLKSIFSAVVSGNAGYGPAAP